MLVFGQSPPDPGEAVQYYRDASWWGSAEAMFRLGKMYRDGRRGPDGAVKQPAMHGMAAPPGLRMNYSVNRYCGWQAEEENHEAA